MLQLLGQRDICGFRSCGFSALPFLSLSYEGHEAPERGTGHEDDPQDGEDGAPALQIVLKGAADRRPDQLKHAVDEERDAVRRGELLHAQHVCHDDGRHPDVDARGDAEDAAVDRDHRVGFRDR